MCSYQRLCHWNGGIGSLGCFGIRGVWGVVWYEGGENWRHLHMGILMNEVVCAHHYYSRRIKLAHVGGGKAGLFELGTWCVLQNLVPYVWELIFTQVSIKWRVIYMNVNSLLDVHSDSLWLPVNNGNIQSWLDVLWSCYGGGWGVGP